MWIIPSGRSSNYLARFGIFLTMAALIVGMVGCVPTQYDLTISSAEGGEVTTPGEGTFSYEKGTVVNLTAEADEGYQFFNWTGNVSTIDDVNAATTTITINDDYTITANFALIIPILDWYDLDAIRDNLGGSYILMNDLDDTTAGYTQLASPTANEGKGWQPIGGWDAPFTGRFEGQGYEIHDLFINRPEEYIVGLFGPVYEGAVIKNVGLVNADVTGYDPVGGLVAINIVGNISYCYSIGSVTGTGSTHDVTGVGGLVGINYGDISYCYSTGSVTGVSPTGGLVGSVYFGTVSNSYSSGSVSGQDGVGGLTGKNSLGTVSNSYATGSVTGTSYVGGLVGRNSGHNATVSNSYSAGDVTGDANVGGLVGWNDGGTVSNTYSSGNVTGNSLVGGLVGSGYGVTVSNSFWDTETSGQATSDGGTGKSTTEMQDIATFSGATWEIVAVANTSTRNLAYIWNIVDNETYPFLSWQL